MAGRVYLVNVGANASHRYSGPIFDDGTFEFIPIPEDPPIQGPHAVRYRDLMSSNGAGSDPGLTRFLPSRVWDVTTHYDPEFETFTYGDNCGTSPRAASLKRVEKGDYIFFLVRLTYWRDGQFTGEHGFYLVGHLEVEEVLTEVRERPDDGVLRRYGANAHVRKGLTNPTLWNGFWVFKGSPRSQRYRHAVPFTRELCDRVLTAADGTSWRWDGGRTELQVIGSYTRSCRCVLDPSVPGHAERAAALWEWVEEQS